MKVKNTISNKIGEVISITDSIFVVKLPNGTFEKWNIEVCIEHKKEYPINEKLDNEKINGYLEISEQAKKELRKYKNMDLNGEITWTHNNIQYFENTYTSTDKL